MLKLQKHKRNRSISTIKQNLENVNYLKLAIMSDVNVKTEEAE